MSSLSILLAGAATVLAAEPPTPIPLRVVDSINFSQQGYFAWAGPPVCDRDGNLFFVPAPHASAQSTDELARPLAILRVGADGEQTTFDPTADAAFADAQESTTISMAIDDSGNPYALVWSITGPASGSQYIVALTSSGKYLSRRRVDPDEMLVNQLEVFGTGDFLLRGQWPRSQMPRLAILSAANGSLQDVIDFRSEGFLDGLAFDHMARGGDGRIYVVPQTRDSIDAISAYPDNPEAPFAHYREASSLEALPGDPKLMGLRASGRRLIVVYSDEPSEPGRGADWWLAAYDNPSDFGPLTAVYGPAPGPPVCYVRKGSRDTFTFLQGAQLLEVMRPER